MAGKGLQELGLKNEVMPEQSYDDLPEFGQYKDPPQPGPYRFQMPGDVEKCFDLIDHETQGQRLKLLLDKDAPLRIAQSPGGTLNNDTFQTQLTNVARKRGKDGPEASDMDYLLKAFGEKSKPKTNADYGQKVMAGKSREFGADIRWSWFCNDKKNIWVYGGTPGQEKLTEVDGTKGCGRRFYQENQTHKDEQKIKKQEDGTFPLQVTCPCGAIVKAFANLDNIRA